MSQQTGSRERANHAYILCGWRTLSDIPLTGIPTSMDHDGDPDVTIQIASGPSPLGERQSRYVFQHSEECSIIGISNVADFEIREGKQIRVWPAPGAASKEVEIFLFGPAWASLCHQRGTLPLHASAIVTGTGITAFAGHSGAGKSTTGGLLHVLGYELIADDILPVSFDQDSTPGAWPYLRRLKLHYDSISQLALTPTEVVSKALDTKKYFVHPEFAGRDKWRRLERLYLLEYAESALHPFIEHITGADAVRAIVDQTYHFSYILGTQKFGDHLAFCTRLAAQIRVYRLCRPKLPFSAAGKELGSFIRAHIEGVCGIHATNQPTA